MPEQADRWQAIQVARTATGGTAAVKIIDMLGEELVVTLPVSWLLPSAPLGVAEFFCYKIVAAGA